MRDRVKFYGDGSSAVSIYSDRIKYVVEIFQINVEYCIDDILEFYNISKFINIGIEPSFWEPDFVIKYKKFGKDSKSIIGKFFSKVNDDKLAIKEYLSSLPEGERAEGYRIRHKIVQKGTIALEALNTRQLKGKLWEIKFSQNRIMYVLADSDNIYFLNACKKQKGKAEKFELEKAIQRAKEAGFTV